MNKILQVCIASVLALFTAGSAIAQDADSLDARVNAMFASITGPFVSFIFAPLPGTSFPWIVLWLVVAASIFTVYFAFVQLRWFGHAISLVKGDYWMIFAGLLGMASKFTECTLGVKYRNEYPDGTVSGGPMYYISKGFKERGVPGGKFLAILFSVFCILGALGGGNMFQANQAHAQISGIVGDYPGWITGVVFALVVFAVIVGGVKSIARVTEKVVPFMGILYVGAAVVILIMKIQTGSVFE